MAERLKYNEIPGKHFTSRRVHGGPHTFQELDQRSLTLTRAPKIVHQQNHLDKWSELIQTCSTFKIHTSPRVRKLMRLSTLDHCSFKPDTVLATHTVAGHVWTIMPAYIKLIDTTTF